MKLAIVTPAQAPYHRCLQEAVARELARNGDSLYLLMLDRQRGGTSTFQRSEVIPEFRNGKVELIPGKQKLLAQKMQTYPSWRVFRACQNYRPDVIWVHEYAPFNWTAIWWAWLNRKPILVGTEVGKSNIQTFGWAARLLRKIWGYRMSGIIAHSPPALDPVEKVDSHSVIRAFYAANLAEFAPMNNRASTDDRIHLGFTGHLIPRKGIDLLLKALAVAEKHGKFHLHLVGAPTAWADEQIKNFPGRTPISLHGYLEGAELREVMGKWDVFVLPSRFDTYGAVVHEAAALGLALLVSQNAGAKALVKEGVNGWTMDPSNPNGFAEKLLRFLEFSKLVHFQRAARGTAEEFSAEKNAISVVELARQSIS